MDVKILEQMGHDFLWIDNELWMWDIPEERRAQKHLADQAYGDVLVAGYGLGVVQKYLLQNDKVNTIITVELYYEVIEACTFHYGDINGMYFIHDFYKLPEKFNKSFDCVIGDVWSDIIPECLEEYKKFKEVAKKHLKPDGKIIAWGQELFEYLICKENGVER